MIGTNVEKDGIRVQVDVDKRRKEKRPWGKKKIGGERGREGCKEEVQQDGEKYEEIEKK